MKKIEYWLLVHYRTLNGFVESEGGEMKPIQTSRIVVVDIGNRLVITAGGSEYQLGEPHDYMPVVSDGRPPIEYLDNIVRMNTDIFNFMELLEKSDLKFSGEELADDVVAHAVQQGYFEASEDSKDRLQLTFKGMGKRRRLLGENSDA